MRFDVYKMPKGSKAGYLVDVQSELLQDLTTRIVIPLYVDPKLPLILKELNPRFDVLGEHVVLMTQELAAIQKRQLQSRVASIPEFRDEILRALDLLFTGF